MMEYREKRKCPPMIEKEGGVASRYIPVFAIPPEDLRVYLKCKMAHPRFVFNA